MTAKPSRLEEHLAGLAVLDEPVRRSLYFHVVRYGPEVSRDQAAQAVGVSRALAAFHLDRLVEAGLLQFSFRRLSGRQGPGAGRPSKLYSRSSHQLQVTLPERRYELAGQLLARAVVDSESKEAAMALRHAARELGARLGAEARARAGRRAGRERLVEAAMDALHDSGFEPARTPEGTLVLRNCPFDALASQFRDLVCSMNLALIEGLVEGLGARDLAARLMPAEGRCCVVLQPGSRR